MDLISREEARALGLKRYYTGIECGNGHNDQRLVSNSNCVECGREHRRKNLEAYRKATNEHRKRNIEEYRRRNRERKKAYKAANRDKVLESQRKNYHKYAEIRREKSRKYRRDNQEARKLYDAEYRKQNALSLRESANRWVSRNKERVALIKSRHKKSDKGRASSRKHAAVRRTRKLSCKTAVQWYEMLEMQTLYEEATLLGSDWHVDHILPLSKGGEHRPYNMQIVQSKYNLWKMAKIVHTPEDIGKHPPEYSKETLAVG